MPSLDRKAYIVDDDDLVRATLRQLLTAMGVYTREFTSAEEYMSHHDALDPGCILLDLCLPKASGLELVRWLHEKGSINPVVMISGRADIPDAVEAIKLGAIDFIKKPFRREGLRDVIEKAFQAIPQFACRNSRMGRTLSQREMAVLKGMANGNTSKEIARDLDISPRTVEMHRANILVKFDVKSAAQAVLVARDLRLI